MVGLGPAGYTLSHYLLNEGFGVVAIDGLKIEPLPEDIVGTAEGRAHGGGAVKAAPRPIRAWSEIYRPLDERVLEGFGGVSEYGITVRWDKNFLTLIHLTLARREKLRIYGGVRFGGALPLDEAWGMGIDHVAIAAGAGRPTIIDIKNNLIRGIRKASDFLMALQLTGAFKKDALSNLQARLPAVVIGGGLTGVDTATELMAYYPIQVEKTLDRYDALVRDLGEARVRGMMDAEELGILDEFRGHGQAVKAERARAQRGRRGAELHRHDPRLGRRHARVSQAPAGCAGLPPESRRGDPGARRRHLGHREHQSGGGDPGRVRPRHGDGVHARRRLAHRAAGADRARRGGHGPERNLRERTSGIVPLDSEEKFFQGFKPFAWNARLQHLSAVRSWNRTATASSRRTIPTATSSRTTATTIRATTATSSRRWPRRSTAIRTSSRCSPSLAALDPTAQPQREQAWQSLVAKLDDQLLARVEKVERLTPTIVEVIVRAPAAARHFHPGSSTDCRTSNASARTCASTITSPRC